MSTSRGGSGGSTGGTRSGDGAPGRDHVRELRVAGLGERAAGRPDVGAARLVTCGPGRLGGWDRFRCVVDAALSFCSVLWLGRGIVVGSGEFWRSDMAGRRVAIIVATCAGMAVPWLGLASPAGAAPVGGPGCSAG